MLDLTGPRALDFDIVHNHATHYLPLAMAPALQARWCPRCTARPRRGWSRRCRAVGPHRPTWSPSARTPPPRGRPARRRPAGRRRAQRGRPGPLGRRARRRAADLVGPHRAGEGHPPGRAGRAGRRPRAADRRSVVDRGYFDRTIAPFLGRGVTHLGHLDHPELAAAVGRASVALVTPCWDEPYGLVVAEALACGTRWSPSPAAASPRSSPRSAAGWSPRRRRGAGRGHPGADALAHSGPGAGAGTLLGGDDGRPVRAALRLAGQRGGGHRVRGRGTT